MLWIKKLSFAPLYLIFYALFVYQLNNLLSIPNLVFSLDFAVLKELIIFVIFAYLACIIFVIFCSLAQDWKLVIPVILLSSLIPFVFLTSPASLTLVFGSFILSLIIYLLVLQKLNSYITWQPTSLFSSSIKQMAFLLSIFSALCFYIVNDSSIKQNGFEIPDSLIDTSLKLMPQSPLDLTNQDLPTQAPQLPKLPPEQIEELKKNPDLLSQFGLTPAALDLVSKSSSNQTSQNNSQTSLQSPIKDLIKSQIESIINPYKSFIAPILALLFFFTTQFFISFLGIFISPLVWLIFYLLEKTEFIKFVSEQRTVKKIII